MPGDAQTDSDNDTERDSDTISVPGLGDVASPSTLREQNQSKYDTDNVAVPHECPVRACSKTGFQTFKQLRGHFGQVSDAAHRAYDLDIDDYRTTSE